MTKLDPSIVFLAEMKNFFNNKGIKLILVWDQINNAFNQQIFEMPGEKDVPLNVNPFETFNENELKQIIRLDCKNYHPKDFTDIESYSEKIFELVQGSLSEYHHFKKAWNWLNFESDISHISTLNE